MYCMGYLQNGFGMSYGSLKYPDTSINIPCPRKIVRKKIFLLSPEAGTVYGK
jgi:hypothetical protein